MRTIGEGTTPLRNKKGWGFKDLLGKFGAGAAKTFRKRGGEANGKKGKKNGYARGVGELFTVPNKKKKKKEKKKISEINAIIVLQRSESRVVEKFV